MKVGIVIVTHGQTGQSLIDDAEFILSQSLATVRFVPLNQSSGDSLTVAQLEQIMADSDSGDGVLVLTDLIGSSPSNLVAALLPDHHAMMVTGINLAMLIRVWNYRDKALASLGKVAIDGGKRGVEAIGP